MTYFFKSDYTDPDHAIFVQGGHPRSLAEQQSQGMSMRL
jgi:hypothetical protein